MKHTLRKAVLGGGIIAGLTLSALPAFAAPTPGSDQTVDHIRGAGSDTTYEMMQRLDVLYNGSVGCALITGSPSFGSTCNTPLTGVDTENYDHDTVVDEYPIGSGNGRTKLRLAPLNGELAQARSSDARDANNVKENGLSMSAFAKDGLAVVAFFGTKGADPGFPVSPTTLSLTQAQVSRIFTGVDPTPGSPQGCPANWSDLGITISGNPAIRPYGIQTGSGTYKSFRSLLGNNDPNTCANAIGSGRIFFENNVAPIDGGTGTDGTVYPGPAADRSTAIWWMSNGTTLVDKVATGTARKFQVGGVAPDTGNIQNNSYPFTRFLWHVNRKVDVSYSAPLGSAVNDPATVAPATGGTQGAARAYRSWLCRNGGHAAQPKNYNTEITNAISASGFVRVSTGTPGDTSTNPITGVAERCKLDNFVANGAADPLPIPANWQS
jgi:ABC-type phosphate transport system substrate-binding protein